MDIDGCELDPQDKLPPAARGVADRLSLLIFKAGVLVLTRAQDDLEALGIDGRDYTALAVLDRDQPESQQELAKLMGKAPAIVVGVVDNLEGKGLVARARAPHDRRRTVVTLTAKGRKVLEKADDVAARVEQELFGELSADEVSTLHTMLRRALAADAVPA